MTERNYLNLKIEEADHGREIRSILHRLGVSAEKLKSLKQVPGGILLDGAPVYAKTRASRGQLLSLDLSDSSAREDRIFPMEMPLKIAFEDRNLMVLNKSAGIVCHPSKGHYFDSLANGVRDYLLKTDPAARIHFVGRLDKDTSGLLLIAKNSITADKLQHGKRAQNTAGIPAFTKHYTAIASGIFPEKTGVIRLPIGTGVDSEGNVISVLGEENDPRYAAETSYRIIGENSAAGYSVADVLITTGRMHQIRFHFSAIGHPLLGDPVYGKSAAKIAAPRCMLHARELEFVHPWTGEKMHFSAETPEEMNPFLHCCP